MIHGKDGVTRHRTSLTNPDQPCASGTIAKGGVMAQTRKLYRSRTDRKLAGVCRGLAQYFNLDATLFRILFVVLALLWGLRPAAVAAGR